MLPPMTKVGVFDSGVGGLSVAAAIERALPSLEVVYVNDRKNVPYGSKTHDVLLELVTPILQKLIDDGFEVIVIACNTATTLLISELRERLTVPLIGIEPMVKTATAITKTDVIAVCATPATLQSNRYTWLKSTYASGKIVLEPDCSQWSYMIEHNKVNDAYIQQQITAACDAGADVIVLGCTHYHWIEEKIRTMAQGRAEVLQPEQAIVRQLQNVLADLQ